MIKYNMPPVSHIFLFSIFFRKCTHMVMWWCNIYDHLHRISMLILEFSHSYPQQCSHVYYEGIISHRSRKLNTLRMLLNLFTTKFADECIYALYTNERATIPYTAYVLCYKMQWCVCTCTIIQNAFKNIQNHA